MPLRKSFLGWRTKGGEIIHRRLRPKTRANDGTICDGDGPEITIGEHEAHRIRELLFYHGRLTPTYQ